MDEIFQDLNLQYEKKLREHKDLLSKLCNRKEPATKDEVNQFLVVNFEIQNLCELLLERKAELEPNLLFEISRFLKKSREFTYNC